MDTETPSEATRSPLFTYLVTKNIFNFLDYNQLKSTRFVCRFWNDVAFPILQSKSVIVINSSTALMKHMNYIEYLNDNVKGYDDEIAESQSQSILQENPHFHNAFPNYRIKLPDSEWEGLVFFQQFWECYKSGIKQLTLEMPPNFGRRILKRILCDPNCELEMLKIRILHFFADRDVESQKNDTHSNLSDCFCDEKGNIIVNRKLVSFSYTLFAFDGADFVFPVNWTVFIQRFSRLKKLELVGIPAAQLDEIIGSISVCRKIHEKCLEINSLGILNEDLSSVSPGNFHLEKLKDLSLPLDTLSLEIGRDIAFRNLEILLHKYKDTLQKLQLRRYPFENNRFTFSPSSILVNLTRLDISDKFVHNLNFILNSSANAMPKLKSLKISIRDYRHLSETDIIENTLCNLYMKPNETLRELTIEPLITFECVRKIVKWFPELRYLKLRVDDMMVRTIFSGLKKLKEIYFIAIIYIDNYNLHRTTLSDEGITGIPLDILKSGHNISEADKMLPSIAALQDLEKITIESWHDYGSGITDYSICYGFMELKNLYSIHLERTLVSSQGLGLLSSLPNIENISTI